MKPRFPGSLAAILALAGMVALVPAFRLGFLARAELAAARSASAAGRRGEALVLYERAARCSFPFSPFASEAFDGIAGLSEAWERDGEVVHAVAAAESERGILLGTGAAGRSPGRLREATARVVRLRRSLALLAAPGSGPGPASSEAEVRATLERPREPRLPAALAGIACFWGAALLISRVPAAWSRPGGPGSGLGRFAGALALAALALALLRYA